MMLQYYSSFFFQTHCEIWTRFYRKFYCTKRVNDYRFKWSY